VSACVAKIVLRQSLFCAKPKDSCFWSASHVLPARFPAPPSFLLVRQYPAYCTRDFPLPAPPDHAPRARPQLTRFPTPPRLLTRQYHVVVPSLLRREIVISITDSRGASQNPNHHSSSNVPNRPHQFIMPWFFGEGHNDRRQVLHHDGLGGQLCR
jgi:hypothetical protein